MKIRLATILLILLALPLSEASGAVRVTGDAGNVRTFLKIIKKIQENKREFAIAVPYSSEDFFNDGWRWTYRKKASSILIKELYGDNDVEFIIMREALGLHSPDKHTFLIEARALVEGMKSEGDNKKAGALSAIISFYERKRPEGFEALTDSKKSSVLHHLGQFLMGSYNERRGFFPEASGYYSNIAKETKDPFLRNAALFLKARLLFLDGKYEQAKDVLKPVVDAGGILDAGLWLASTCLLKGEYELAERLFNANRKPVAEIDSLNLLAMGDMLMIRRDFDKARVIFEHLKSRYPKDDFLDAFFSSRIGDTYAVEGKAAEAEKVYSKTKVRFNGEPWAVASLGLADLYISSNDKDLMDKALKAYQAVAGGDYAGSEMVRLNLIDAEIRTGRYDEALSEIKKFQGRYPTSALRHDLPKFYGVLVYRWMDSLYASGDYKGMLKVSFEHGSNVPFGRKAEMNLKTGKAASASGLYPHAVRSLDSAIKFGASAVSEEAMVELAKVYLNQSDAGAAERLLRSFNSRFPNSKYASEAERLLFRTLYMKGDYRSAAGSKAPLEGPEDQMLRASALAKTLKYKEASAWYAKAAAAFNSMGELVRARAAYMGKADAEFTSGSYKDAVDSYRLAISADPEIKSEDRAWALYRMVQAFSRLDMNRERQEAVAELKGLNVELSTLMESVFKEPAGL